MKIDQDESNALAALDLAREELKPIAPDQWDGAGAETRSWVSVLRLEEALAPVLAKVGIVIELVGTKLVGGVGISSTWRWRYEGWRSEPTTIEAQIEQRGDLGATAATKAAVTSSRRIYVEQLLGIRQLEDHEGDLCREMDRGRGVALMATKRALRAYCQRYKVNEDRAIRLFLGVDPGPGVEATVEQLPAPMIATLWYRLLCQVPEASVAYDFAAPGRFGGDDLPPELGGAEVAHG